MADVAEWNKLKESLVGYLESDDISPTLAQALRIPSNRHAIYYWLAGNQHHEFRALLQHLLDLEISFRQSEELKTTSMTTLGASTSVRSCLDAVASLRTQRRSGRFNA